MVDILKGFFGIKKDDDNIPQIHLNKNEPKYNYDPIKKKWVIEGEPEEEEKPNLPPPMMKKNKKNVVKKSKNKKNNSSTSRRYASVLGEENIFHPQNENK